MANSYYAPNQPRQIFRTPLTTSQYVQGAGRCSHCPGWNSYCAACREELAAFKTYAQVLDYERGVQAGLGPVTAQLKTA